MHVLCHYKVTRIREFKRVYSLHYEIGGVFNRAAIMSIGVGQSSPFW